MKMSKFSEQLGISEYTIRYYERIGILSEIARDKSGYRVFSDSDFLWMQFVLRLRKTGMSVEEIVDLARARSIAQGGDDRRLQILEAHRDKLSLEIEDKLVSLQKIQEKIDFFRK